MNLFKSGHFILASGQESCFKIECDALTLEDWDTLALMIVMRAKPFGAVVGVPTGGEQLAKALQKYVTKGPTLLVDDVLTTGQSIREMKLETDQVWVVFARNRIDGINALFYMD